MPTTWYDGDFSPARIQVLGRFRPRCGSLAISAPPVVVCSGAMAMLLLPERLMIAGFDDYESVFRPMAGITAVRVPRYEIGRRATEIVLARLAGDEAWRRPVAGLDKPRP